MKLYTENQVRLLLDLAKLNVYGTKVYSKDELLDKLTPIELPSDNKINTKAREHWRKGQIGIEKYADTEYSFNAGAKWVINQIKQQDK